ncbi:MAG: integrase arm-type DNA-binding domain-containing protein [Deltaproteobacteria bacterium]
MTTLRLTENAVRKFPSPTDVPQTYYWDEEVKGLGVVVGKTGARTFVVYARLAGEKGKRVKHKLGIFGQPRDDKHVWSVELARAQAKKVIGTLASGTNPNAKVDTAGVPFGPTLRDGVDTHLAKMKKRGRAARSIQSFTHETTKYLADWLDRPFSELTGAKLIELHQQIKDKAAKREGTNPANDKGAPLANRVIAHVSASWRSLNKKLEGKLGNWNPASAVDRDTIKPKRERIQDEDLKDYAARVASMRSPIKRDGLMIALFTGLRNEDVRTMRFEHVDWDEETLDLPNPKGGEGAAFTIPLSSTPLSILRRRERDNLKDLGRSDEGWCFPGIDQTDAVGPIADLRQSSRVRGGRFPVEDVHSLRRTWESIANDEGISELDQHVLSNHSFGSHNVNATYISQHIDHLGTCADKIDKGIARRIKGTPDGNRKARRGKILLVA